MSSFSYFILTTTNDTMNSKESKEHSMGGGGEERGNALLREFLVVKLGNAQGPIKLNSLPKLQNPSVMSHSALEFEVAFETVQLNSP